MLVAMGSLGTDLFPAVHGLLVFLETFEEEDVDYFEVLDVSMSLELVTDSCAHLGRGDCQSVQRTNFRCL